MSTLGVAKKDFRGAKRSRLLWSAAIGLGFIAVFTAYVSGNTIGAGRQNSQELFKLLTQILSVLLPIVAIVGTYLAIAGEREGGGIKFMLSLPNTRLDVFAGKLFSRLAIVAGGVVFMYIAAISVTLTRHDVFPAGVIVGTLLLTVVYGSTFVSIGLAMSAAAASRGRAIAGAIGSYFLLVILYVFPMVRVSMIARWIHTTLLGADPNPDLYNAVQYTSPFLAYRKAKNLVLPDDFRQIIFHSSLPEDISYGSADTNAALPIYLQDEVSLLILGFWLVVPLVVGYWLFERADLE